MYDQSGLECYRPKPTLAMDADGHITPKSSPYPVGWGPSSIAELRVRQDLLNRHRQERLKLGAGAFKWAWDLRTLKEERLYLSWLSKPGNGYEDGDEPDGKGVKGRFAAWETWERERFFRKERGW